MSRVPEGRRGVEGPRPPHPLGFTLLELLVSLFILSFLMAGLYYTLGPSTLLARSLQGRFEREYDVRVALRRMAADFEAAYTPPGEKTPFISEGPSFAQGETAAGPAFLTFLSPWNAGEGSGDLALVGYSLQRDPEGRGNLLVRRWVPWLSARPEEEPRTAVILEGVKEMILQFAEIEGAAVESQPRGQTPAKSLIPAAVRVTLVLEGDGGGERRFSTLLPIPVGIHPVEPAAAEGAGAGTPPAGGGAGGVTLPRAGGAAR